MTIVGVSAKFNGPCVKRPFVKVELRAFVDGSGERHLSKILQHPTRRRFLSDIDPDPDTDGYERIRAEPLLAARVVVVVGCLDEIRSFEFRRHMTQSIAAIDIGLSTQ